MLSTFVFLLSTLVIFICVFCYCLTFTVTLICKKQQGSNAVSQCIIHKSANRRYKKAQHEEHEPNPGGGEISCSEKVIISSTSCSTSRLIKSGPLRLIF